MIRSAAICMLMGMLACVPEVKIGAKVGPKIGPSGPLRDTSVKVMPVASFEVRRFEGDWLMRGTDTSSQTLGAVSVEVKNGLLELGELHGMCGGSGKDCEAWGDMGTGSVTSAGCMSLTYTGGHKKKVCVLWVDPDYQTAALGSPDGSFAWVVDRNASGGDARIMKALEALAANGFDTTQIKVGHDG